MHSLWVANGCTRCRPGATKVLRTMTSLHSDADEAYKAAISTLNGLQTNAAVLQLIRDRKGDRQVSEYNKMQQYLHRVELTPADLQQLNAIHVSGTKGKGSVCAMTESILRRHGYKTGLFVSPHLLEVRERIRINGQPLSRASFVTHFWNVFSKLHETRHLYNDAMPSYFRFLTVMAFSVFLQDKVDVAVVEVGIGGTHDSTNIIEKPVVCGITSLGYDHTDILGPTLSDIAWHKGGICKEQCPVLTVEQPPEALKALCHRADELKAQPLVVIPPLSSYSGPPPALSLRGKHQATNASLAAQLCHTWLQKHLPSQETSSIVSTAGTVPTAKPFELTQQFREGLWLCKWAGRNQVVVRGNVTYYLDGAHTPESVNASAEWFLSEVGGREHAARVLLFNTTGHRDAQAFLLSLVICGFSHIVLCPNIAHPLNSPSPNSADHSNHMVTYDSQLAHCSANEQCIRVLLSTAKEGKDKKPQTKVLTSTADALHYVETLGPSQVDVLVTGSLHLVGTIMSVLGFTVDDV